MALFKRKQNNQQYVEFDGKQYIKVSLNGSTKPENSSIEVYQNVNNGRFLVKHTLNERNQFLSDEYAVLEFMNGTTQFRAKKHENDECWLLLVGAKELNYKCLRAELFEEGNEYTIIQDSRPIVIETGVINFEGPSTPAKHFPGLVGFMKRDGGFEKFGVFYNPECHGSVCSYQTEENGNRVFLAKDGKEFESETGSEHEVQELVELYNAYLEGNYTIGELPMEFYTNRKFFDAVYETEKEQLKRLRDIYEIEQKKRDLRKLEKFEKAFFGEELVEAAQKQ